MERRSGMVHNHHEIATGLTGAKAWRITYSSHDVNGSLTVSTGIVVAPNVVSSGAPVMTWCHGTTGLGDAACPSAQPDPARELITYFTAESTQQIDYGVPGLQAFIDEGWVVCATDYQGLGTDGMHQYIVNRTNALDAVNIVHAAREIVPAMGARFGCMGWSQGGGAAAAVAELEPSDYGDLVLVGTVPMSPGVPSIALAHPAGPSAAASDASLAPDSHLVMLMCGFQAANPNTLELSDVFTPLGVGIINQAWNTQPVHHLNDTIARMFKLNGPIMKAPPENSNAWQVAIAAGSAGSRKPCAPILMCVDEFDGGTVVPVVWQTAYQEAVEALGGSVEVRRYPHDDHFSLPASCVTDALAWLANLIRE